MTEDIKKTRFRNLTNVTVICADRDGDLDRNELASLQL